MTLKTLVTPTGIRTTSGVFSHLECVRNTLGAPDSSGRRRPVPLEDSEFTIELDTLIVAISEDSGVDSITPARSGGIETTEWNTVKVDPNNLLASRPGVFAAGDVVTGPNTIVDAIAAGKRAASMIERHLRGLPLELPVASCLPSEYVEPAQEESEGPPGVDRIETPRASVEWRKRNFAEVEVTLSPEEAHCEASRCLRCDLEFTKRDDPQSPARTEVDAEMDEATVGG
jgi:formate dehydrogenase beta subunit